MKRLINRVSFFISSVLFVIIVLFTNIVYAEKNEKEKLEVLFISSYSLNFISFEDQVQGIREGLNNNANIKIEYMNSSNIDLEENELRFYDLVKMNLENYNNYDAIIVGDDEALEFTLKYREDIFKSIPIVFLGIQRTDLIRKAFEFEGISGVRELESVEENIDLIKKLHSNIENIIFLNDCGENFYPDLVEKNPQFNFGELITNELSIDEFRKVISELEENTAIISLYPNHFKDREWLNTQDINKMIAELNPNIPVYSILNYSIGTGSIGGKVIKHFEQGRLAGQIVLQLLEGKDEEEVYIGYDLANKHVFDYNVLKNFNIRISSLPDNSEIINNPLNIIKEYKSVFIITCIMFLTLLLLVVALIKHIQYKNKFEKEIIKAKDKAEEINRLKSYFISNISHELKTPINVILCAAQLLESKKVDNYNINNKNNTIDIIKDNSYRLIRLINNIIDVEKGELDELTLNLKKDNLVSLIEDIVTSVIPYAKRKELNLIFDTEEEEIIMDMDIEKIERIILNLLSNAIKFSNENGNIYIRIMLNNDDVDIVVEDEGIGISKDDIPYIFDKFIQVDNTFNRKNEGSGIGLAIVKSFIEIHNGKIMVESQVGKGTKFIVKLPKIINNEDTTGDSHIYKSSFSEKNIIDELTSIKCRVKKELSDIYA